MKVTSCYFSCVVIAMIDVLLASLAAGWEFHIPCLRTQESSSDVHSSTETRIRCKCL